MYSFPDLVYIKCVGYVPKISYVTVFVTFNIKESFIMDAMYFTN